MNSLIQCSHADFGYENQDAVVDVTMEVNPGDYVCIVGVQKQLSFSRRIMTSLIIKYPGDVICRQNMSVI